MSKSSLCYVIVGGIGEVYSGRSIYDARLCFDFYVLNSRGWVIDPNSDFIRGVNQPVQFFINGEVFEEFIPPVKVRT